MTTFLILWQVAFGASVVLFLVTAIIGSDYFLNWTGFDDEKGARSISKTTFVIGLSLALLPLTLVLLAIGAPLVGIGVLLGKDRLRKFVKGNS